MLLYKVVETSIVTDEALEKVINEWVALGWTFDEDRFVVREASKRPAMAFVFFTRNREDTSPQDWSQSSQSSMSR
jgi:hypothetical protein